MSKRLVQFVYFCGLMALSLPVFAQEAPLVDDIAQEPVAAPQEALPVMAVSEGEGFVPARENMDNVDSQPAATAKVVYNPSNRRDPTLSPDEFLLLQYREKQRLAAEEAERQRKLEEERRKRLEEERRRQEELELIKDPTRAVRNKINVGGIIGQEVFIGSKIYTVGKSIYGATIVEVRPEEVVFSYKGHKFIRKVKLK